MKKQIITDWLNGQDITKDTNPSELAGDAIEHYNEYARNCRPKFDKLSDDEETIVENMCLAKVQKSNA